MAVRFLKLPLGLVSPPSQYTLTRLMHTCSFIHFNFLDIIPAGAKVNRPATRAAVGGHCTKNLDTTSCFSVLVCPLFIFVLYFRLLSFLLAS